MNQPQHVLVTLVYNRGGVSIWKCSCHAIGGVKTTEEMNSGHVLNAFDDHRQRERMEWWKARLAASKGDAR